MTAEHSPSEPTLDDVRPRGALTVVVTAALFVAGTGLTLAALWWFGPYAFLLLAAPLLVRGRMLPFTAGLAAGAVLGAVGALLFAGWILSNWD